MYYQVAITLLLVAFLANLVLNLKSLKRLGNGKSKIPDPAPLISVLIPARNEAANIGPCVESLCRQDYPSFEVLVLDDDSSDDTAAIAGRAAAEDARVRLIRGKPLPPGWVGKPHACHQLAMEAKGEWLLFADADTVHAPQALRGALAHALQCGLSLVSGWPHQRCVSAVQKVVVPVFIFMILCLIPLWWLHGQRRPRLALTVGQFVFIRTPDYWDIGGHEAVKSRILEDMWLGVNAINGGKRQEALDLSNVVSTRMYRGVDDLWEGFTKWVYAIACISPLGLGLLMVTLCCAFVGPFLWLAWHFAPVQAPFDWFLLVLAQVAIILLMRNMIDRQFRHSKRYAVTHPLGVAFLALSCVYAFVRHIAGEGIRWKGRVYGAAAEASELVEPAPRQR